MAGAVAIGVEGLAELQAALRELDVGLQRQLKKELLESAEPVSRTAHSLAVSQIPRMTEPWSQFRIGSLAALVYIAPRQKGTRTQQRRRPNLATLLLTRSMEPALAANETLVAGKVEQAIGRVVKASGF